MPACYFAKAALNNPTPSIITGILYDDDTVKDSSETDVHDIRKLLTITDPPGGPSTCTFLSSLMTKYVAPPAPG